MKKARLAVFDLSVYIYGNDEKGRFLKEFSQEDGNSYGMTSGNGVWIGECDDMFGLIYHEANHIVDWILVERLKCDFVGLMGSSEIRAYLLEWVGKEIRKYVLKEIE